MADCTNVTIEPIPEEPLLTVAAPPAEGVETVAVEECPILAEPQELIPVDLAQEALPVLQPQEPLVVVAAPLVQDEEVAAVAAAAAAAATTATETQETLVSMEVVPTELIAAPAPDPDPAPVLQQEEPVAELQQQQQQQQQPMEEEEVGGDKADQALPMEQDSLAEALPEEEPQQQLQQQLEQQQQQEPTAEQLLAEGQLTEAPIDQGQAGEGTTAASEAPAAVPDYTAQQQEQEQQQEEQQQPVQQQQQQQSPGPVSPPKLTSYTAVHTTTGIMRYTPGIMSALAGKYSNSSQLVEQLVLNCAGCISLSDIRVLDMSNRKIMNLDPAVFSRMPDLEELDLSFNKIKGFDTQLGLRKLRYLSLKKNCLKSVLTLEQFPNLEELNIEDNMLSPPDQYIAVYLLPKLKKLNGKDVDIRDTIQTMEDTLKDKMIKIWDEDFAARNEIPLNKAETRSLETEFVQRLKDSIQYGPSSLIDFTHHMITVLAEKHVTTQTAYWRKTVPELIQTSNQTPAATGSGKVSIKLPVRSDSPEPGEKQAEGNSLAASLEAEVLAKEAAAEEGGEEEEEEEEESEAPAPAAVSPVAVAAATPTGTPAGKRSPRTLATRSPTSVTASVVGKSSPTKQTVGKSPVKVIVLKRPAPQSEAAAAATNGGEPGAKKVKEEAAGSVETLLTPVKRKRGRPLGSGGKYTKKERTVVDVKPRPTPTRPMIPKASAINSTTSTTTKDKKVSSGYEVIHMLRCHSIEDDPTDAKTNVWKCAFEPSLEKPGTSKWTVASCGGNTVCVTDCSTGKVLKKYQHAKDKEEFYCVAWTTIPTEQDDQSSQCNILAVAGTRGSVKLLHTTQLICYSEIKGDRRPRPINSLLFHADNPTWLLCGSEDIIIWDIGIPEGPEYKCKTKKLYHLAAPGRVLGLVALPSTDFILAGCENGCYGWRMDSKQPMGKKGRAHCVEFLLPSKARLAEAIKGDEEEEEEGEGDMIDGLALLNDKLVASKVACDGAIHVWNLVDALKRRPNNKEVGVTPQATMQWCDSDSVYLDIGTWQGCGSLVSGDDEGKIWVYDTSKLPVNPVKSPTIRKPTHLLYWPDEQPNDNASTSSNDHIIINDVAISSDCKYIVSVTNRNVICIWRKL